MQLSSDMAWKIQFNFLLLVFFLILSHKAPWRIGLRYAKYLLYMDLKSLEIYILELRVKKDKLQFMLRG